MRLIDIQYFGGLALAIVGILIGNIPVLALGFGVALSSCAIAIHLDIDGELTLPEKVLAHIITKAITGGK